MIKGIISFTIYIILIFIGLFINKLYLSENNLFNAWAWDYFIFPFVFPFVFSLIIGLSTKYSLAFIRLIAIFFSLVLLLSIFSTSEFNQMGLEIIEYGCNSIFPHNEVILRNSFRLLISWFDIKWSFFGSCMIVVIFSIFLLFFIHRMVCKVYMFIQKNKIQPE